MSTDVTGPIAVRADAPTVLAPPDPALGLRWRPLATEDGALLTRLVQSVEEADGMPYRTTEAEVRVELEASWRVLSRDTLLGVDAEGNPQAWMQTQTSPGDERVVRVFVHGGVLPPWRGRGVGRELVRWATGRSRQLLAESGKDLPGRVCLYVDDRTPDVARLYTAAGYRPLRYYAEMRRRVTGDGVTLPQAPQVPGVRVVPWSAERDEELRVTHNEVFADHWGSEPRTPEQWAAGHAQHAPAWSFLALDEDDTVVGYVVSCRYEEDWAVAGFTSGYTHLLGVRRAWRGRGLAVALLVSAMQAYARDGMEYAEIGVDTANPSGAHGLYASLGYEVSDSSALYGLEV